MQMETRAEKLSDEYFKGIEKTLGGEEELESLLNEGSRVILLVGAPGSGKTHLIKKVLSKRERGVEGKGIRYIHMNHDQPDNPIAQKQYGNLKRIDTLVLDDISYFEIYKNIVSIIETHKEKMLAISTAYEQYGPVDLFNKATKCDTLEYDKLLKNIEEGAINPETFVFVAHNFEVAQPHLELLGIDVDLSSLEKKVNHNIIIEELDKKGVSTIELSVKDIKKNAEMTGVVFDENLYTFIEGVLGIAKNELAPRSLLRMANVAGHLNRERNIYVTFEDVEKFMFGKYKQDARILENYLENRELNDELLKVLLTYKSELTVDALGDAEIGHYLEDMKDQLLLVDSLFKGDNGIEFLRHIQQKQADFNNEKIGLLDELRQIYTDFKGATLGGFNYGAFEEMRRKFEEAHNNLPYLLQKDPFISTLKLTQKRIQTSAFKKRNNYFKHNINTLITVCEGSKEKVGKTHYSEEETQETYENLVERMTLFKWHYNNGEIKSLSKKDVELLPILSNSRYVDFVGKRDKKSNLNGTFGKYIKDLKTLREYKRENILTGNRPLNYFGVIKEYNDKFGLDSQKTDINETIRLLLKTIEDYRLSEIRKRDKIHGGFLAPVLNYLKSELSYLHP